MNEERLRILKMIESGQLSAEEGARLLEALETPQEQSQQSAAGAAGEAARSLRIRVYDSITGREKINLAIPIAFAKMLSSLIPEGQRAQLEEHGVRFEDVLRSIEAGRVGRIVDIENKERGEKVEISIE